MILYTIYDQNVIFNNADYGEQQGNISHSEMNVDGIMVQVSQTNSNSDICVERILSTNPMDYLNPKLQPGCLIKDREKGWLT